MPSPTVLHLLRGLLVAVGLLLLVMCLDKLGASLSERPAITSLPPITLGAQ